MSVSFEKYLSTSTSENDPLVIEAREEYYGLLNIYKHPIIQEKTNFRATEEYLRFKHYDLKKAWEFYQRTKELCQ